MEFIEILPATGGGIMPWVIGLSIAGLFLAVALFLAWRRARIRHRDEQPWISPADPILKKQALQDVLAAGNLRATARHTAVFIRMCKAYTTCVLGGISFALCGAIFAIDAAAEPRLLWKGNNACWGLWILAAIAVASFLAMRQGWGAARAYRQTLSETK